MVEAVVLFNVQLHIQSMNLRIFILIGSLGDETDCILTGVLAITWTTSQNMYRTALLLRPPLLQPTFRKKRGGGGGGGVTTRTCAFASQLSPPPPPFHEFAYSVVR